MWDLGMFDDFLCLVWSFGFHLKIPRFKTRSWLPITVFSKTQRVKLSNSSRVRPSWRNPAPVGMEKKKTKHCKYCDIYRYSTQLVPWFVHEEYVWMISSSFFYKLQLLRCFHYFSASIARSSASGNGLKKIKHVTCIWNTTCYHQTILKK